MHFAHCRQPPQLNHRLPRPSRCLRPQLREAAAMLQQALNASSVQQEEALWTQIIEKYGGLQANWVPDLVGSAWGNRGNARSRQVGCGAGGAGGGALCCLAAVRPVPSGAASTQARLAQGWVPPGIHGAAAGQAGRGAGRLQPRHRAVPLERGPGAQPVGGGCEQQGARLWCSRGRRLGGQPGRRHGGSRAACASDATAGGSQALAMPHTS